ncbi:MAG TPA: hypothetical protein VK171_08995 [Fimbriimonas sp.]|nr:hypothetical protein [Fimbriimonas sp.]
MITHRELLKEVKLLLCDDRYKGKGTTISRKTEFGWIQVRSSIVSEQVSVDIVIKIENELLGFDYAGLSAILLMKVVYIKFPYVPYLPDAPKDIRELPEVLSYSLPKELVEQLRSTEKLDDIKSLCSIANRYGWGTVSAHQEALRTLGIQTGSFVVEENGPIEDYFRAIDSSDKK